MNLLHVVLIIGFVLLVALIAASRAAERFIGWRYLFRRRHSKGVLAVTVITGVASAAFPTLFLLFPWSPASFGQSVAAFLAVLSFMVFSTFLFLNFFSVFTTVSITGVFCGVATLVVVLSVTSGFQEEFQDKVLGVNAHVIVLKYGIDFSEYRDVMKTAEKLPNVRAVAPFVFHEMMIARGPALSGVLVKGIVPGVSEKVLDIGRMVEGSIDALGKSQPSLDKDGRGGPPLPTILVGKELSKKLKAKVGDRVRIVSPLGDLDPSLWNTDSKSPKMREFQVAGIFSSGFDEYDRRLVIIHMKEGQAFMEGGDVVTGVELRVDDIDNSDQTSRALDLALIPPGERGSPYRVIDWRELNHNLFTALRLQKVALSILLTLIVLVAAFGIVATLTMLVIDKTREIAILKSIGMRGAGIARLFQTAGLTIGALGTLAGIGLGLMICFLVSRYQYRLDPRVYLIERLPVKVNFSEILLTALITLAICFIATIYPSLRAARLKPVEGLRYE